MEYEEKFYDLFCHFLVLNFLVGNANEMHLAEV